MTVRSIVKTKRAAGSVGAKSATTRSYLPAAERKGHLLGIAGAIVRDQGWEGLSITELARRAGVSRQLVHQYFGDLEALVLELAERFQDDVHAIAVEAIECHPDDFAAAMRHTLERFLVGLREERLAFVDLLIGHSLPSRLRSPVKRVRDRKRRRLVEVWAKYYELVNGLDPRDAEALSSFQYDGLRGLIAQVDAGHLETKDAIDLFIEILSAAIERLSRKPARKTESRSRR